MLWKGLTLRTLREQVGTGFDELIESYDDELRLLVLGGIGRCFTQAQALRFLKGETALTVGRLLESMSGYNRLLVKYHLGAGEKTWGKSNSYVYTVSESGIGKLSRVEPELVERLDFGKLEAFERRRIHHALGVTQVVLNLRDQYNIFDIIPERMVRAELRRENNHRLLHQQARLTLHGFGDLLVELQRKGEEKSYWQEIEISHKNTSKDLKSKDRNLIFYTSSESQKNKVSRYTGAVSYVLGDPFSSEGFQSSAVELSKFEGQDQDTLLSKSDQKVHEVIRNLGDMASLAGISVLTGKAKSTVNESLMRLFKTGYVCQAGVSITPGLKSGRPNAIYLTAWKEKVELEELRRGLSRSLIIQFLVGHYQHEFVGYDEKFGIMTSRTRDAKAIKYHLAFDDQRLTVEELLESIFDCERQLKGQDTSNFRLILHYEKRISAVEAELKKAKSQIQVVNLFSVMEQIKRLERQKSEANKKANSATSSSLPA